MFTEKRLTECAKYTFISCCYRLTVGISWGSSLCPTTPIYMPLNTVNQMGMPTIILFTCFSALLICFARSSADIKAPPANSPLPSQVDQGQEKAPVTTNSCECKRKTYCVAKPDADTDRLLEYVKSTSCYEIFTCRMDDNPYPWRFGLPNIPGIYNCREPEYVRLQVSSYINRVYQNSGDCPLEIGHVITKDPCNGNPQYRIPKNGWCPRSDSCICLFCPARNGH